MKKTFLKGWLRTRLFFLLFVLLLLLLLFAFSYIFTIEPAILHYQLSLVALLGLVFGTMDMLREWRKYGQLLAEQQPDAVLLTASEEELLQRVEQLEQAHQDLQIKELARREEVLDYFTLWAHQIKTPLTASKLLVKELPNSPIKQQLTQEQFRTEQYADLAMNYLRLESFHDDLVLREENAYDLVREVVKKYALFFIQQQIKLELEEFRRQFVTDKKWFAIILEQLLSNSIKYTRAGTIRIYLDGDQLVIADTGIGIQASDLERVFERGFSGFNGRVNQQSSGLGLYLCKTISERLGHKLMLTSQVGVGTEARIDLKQVQYENK